MAKKPKWVTLRDRYEIAIEEPLSQYDNPPAVAFKVRHKKDSSRDLIALICDPKLPTRFNLIGEVRRMEVPYLLSCQDWGVIDWPPEIASCRRSTMKLSRCAKLILSSGSPIRSIRS